MPNTACATASDGVFFFFFFDQIALSDESHRYFTTMTVGQQFFLVALLFLSDLHFTAGHRIMTRRYLIYGANVLRPCNECLARLYDVLFSIF